MTNPIERLASWAAGTDIGPARALGTVSAVIAVRTMLERMFEPPHTLLLPGSNWGNLVDLAHVYVAWLCVFMTVFMALRLAGGMSFSKALSTVTVGSAITLVVPLADLILSPKGGGGIFYAYDFGQLRHTFVNLANPWAEITQVSPGVRLEVTLMALAAMAVVRFQGPGGRRTGWGRCLVAALACYCAAFLYGYLPAMWNEVLPGLLTGGPSGAMPQQRHLFIYLIPLALLLAAFMADHARGLGFTLRDLGPAVLPGRAAFYLLPLNFGFVHAARTSLVLPEIMSDPAGLHLLGAANLSMLILFLSAKLANDVHDKTADAVSNPGRPLPRGLLTPEQARAGSWSFAALSLPLAVGCGAWFVPIWAAVMGLAHLYSAPPLAAKRLFPLGHAALALIALSLTVAGAGLVNADAAYVLFEPKALLGAVAAMFFTASLLKDFKDAEADAGCGVRTLATMCPAPGRARAVLAALALALAGELIWLGNLLEPPMAWAAPTALLASCAIVIPARPPRRAAEAMLAVFALCAAGAGLLA